MMMNMPIFMSVLHADSYFGTQIVAKFPQNKDQEQ